MCKTKSKKDEMYVARSFYKILQL